MHKKLKIGDIKIDYTYHFNDYFQTQIDQYQVPDETVPDYSMTVVLSSHIQEIKGLDYQIIKNRAYHITPELHVATIYHDDHSLIVQQIIFDKEKKDVKIYLNPDYIKELSMQEYILSGVMFLEIAIMEGYLPLHASAISFDEDAILFSAPSQTGKSTHAHFWKSKFKERVQFINDDKPLLFFIDDQCYVTGTPFSGSSTLNMNVIKPVKAIIFLSQGKENKLVDFPKEKSLEHFLQNTWRPKEEMLWHQVLNLVDLVITQVPIYQLFATKDISSVDTVYNTLYKE